MFVNIFLYLKFVISVIIKITINIKYKYYEELLKLESRLTNVWKSYSIYLGGCNMNWKIR